MAITPKKSYLIFSVGGSFIILGLGLSWRGTDWSSVSKKLFEGSFYLWSVLRFLPLDTDLVK